MEGGLEGAGENIVEKKSPEQKQPNVEQKLSFARRDLDNILSQNPFQPEDLVGLFAKDFGPDYEADAGVWEGYTIKQHTLMVMGQFEKYFAHSPLPADVDKNLFRTMLALHDIGKPEAIRMGGKHLQHEYNERKMNTILSQLEFSQHEKDLALAVASADSIGNSIKTGNIETSAGEIIQSAQKANVPPEEFFDLLTVFYRVDAGSYTEDAGGKYSLDHLFEFDREKKELRFSPQTNEKITKLRERVLSLKESNPIQEKETWQMTKKEFGNNFYLQGMHEHKPYCNHEDKSNDPLQSIRKLGVIKEGSFFSARNNDNVEKARESTQGGGVFIIVRADSLPSKKSLQQPMDEIKVNKQDKQSVPYVAEVPLGVDPHKYLVYQAVKDGKAVPQDVLNEYPYALLTGKSSIEDIEAAVEKASPKKEPWQITRDEFGENYYLQGTTEDKAQLIREAGGIQKGAFINVGQDSLHTAIAYATDAPNTSGTFSKSGRGTAEGSVFVSHISEVLTPQQRAVKLKREIDNVSGYTYMVRPPETIQENDIRGRTIPYTAEIPPVEDPHRYLVEQALIEEKPVSEDVLIDYPDIGKTANIKKEIASIEKSSRLKRFSSRVQNAFNRFTHRGK